MESIVWHKTVTVRKIGQELWFTFYHFPKGGLTRAQRQVLRHQGKFESWSLWITATEIRRGIASGVIPNHGMTVTGHKNGMEGPEVPHTIAPIAFERFALTMSQLIDLAERTPFAPDGTLSLYRGNGTYDPWSPERPTDPVVTPPPFRRRRPRRF